MSSFLRLPIKLVGKKSGSAKNQPDQRENDERSHDCHFPKELLYAAIRAARPTFENDEMRSDQTATLPFIKILTR